MSEQTAQENLDFYYDFGSPNVYLAWKALSQVEGVHLNLKPALIGGIFKSTNNQPPWMAFSGVPAKLQYMMAEMRRFAAMYGIAEFRMNPHFPVNTLLAMRTAMAAHQDGVEDAYFKAVQTAMWETGQDVSKPDVLASVLDETGLPGESMVERAQEADIKHALIEATQAAVERGLFGLPSWFADNGGDEPALYFGKDNCWIFGAKPSVLRP